MTAAICRSSLSYREETLREAEGKGTLLAGNMDAPRSNGGGWRQLPGTMVDLAAEQN